MKKGMIAVLATIGGAVGGAVSIGCLRGKQLESKAEKVDKFKSYYNLLDQWLVLKYEGKHLSKYFEENNFHTIAIYGMGEMGKRLYEELQGSSIVVKYAIDKNAESIYSELEIKDLEDTLEGVDAVVVTAIFAFNEIENELAEQIECPIISLEDVVYDN